MPTLEEMRDWLRGKKVEGMPDKKELEKKSVCSVDLSKEKDKGFDIVFDENGDPKYIDHDTDEVARMVELLKSGAIKIPALPEMPYTPAIALPSLPEMPKIEPPPFPPMGVVNAEEAAEALRALGKGFKKAAEITKKSVEVSKDFNEATSRAQIIEAQTVMNRERKRADKKIKRGIWKGLWRHLKK